MGNEKFLIYINEDAKTVNLDEISDDKYCTCILNNGFFYKGFINYTSKHTIKFEDDKTGEMVVNKEKIMIIYWTDSKRNKTRGVDNGRI